MLISRSVKGQTLTMRANMSSQNLISHFKIELTNKISIAVWRLSTNGELPLMILLLKLILMEDWCTYGVQSILSNFIGKVQSLMVLELNIYIIYIYIGEGSTFKI